MNHLTPGEESTVLQRADGEAPHLDDQLCFALYAATHAITRRYRPLLDEIGLTYPQYLLMLVLWQDGSATVGHIARRLELHSHAVTPLVSRLEVAGLIRTVHDSDRRRVVVCVTERGNDLQLAAARGQGQVADATGLTPSELSDLRRRLRLLSNHLNPETRSFPHPAGEAKKIERNIS